MDKKTIITILLIIALILVPFAIWQINQNKVKVNNLEVGEILNEGKESNKIFKTEGGAIIELAVDITNKKVRWDNAGEIMIVKINKLKPSTNYNPVTKKYTRTFTNGEMEIIKVFKGNAKTGEKVDFSRLGGKIPLKEYVKSLSEDQVKKMFAENTKAEKEKRLAEEIFEDTNLNDIEVEEGKTYLAYCAYVKEQNKYEISFFEEGLRELKPIHKAKVEKYELDKKVEANNDIYVKNNKTGKYESIKEVLK